MAQPAGCGHGNDSGTGGGSGRLALDRRRSRRLSPWTRERRCPRDRLGGGPLDLNVCHVMVARDGYVWVSARMGVFRSTTSTFATASTRGTPFRKTAAASPGAAIKLTQQFPAGTDAKRFLWPWRTMRIRSGSPATLRLARWDGVRWTRLTKEDGLKSDMVAQIAEDPAGSLWIGYRDASGITHISYPEGRLTLSHVTTANGLHSDKSLFLGFDAKQRLWVGTDHGADLFDHQKWRYYSR